MNTIQVYKNHPNEVISLKLTSTLSPPVPISSVFLFSGLAPLLDRWDLPVAVFPFNIVIVLYLLCTGPYNPYFPHHLATPAGPMEINATELMAVEVRRSDVSLIK